MIYLIILILLQHHKKKKILSIMKKENFLKIKITMLKEGFVQKGIFSVIILLHKISN